MGARIRIPLWVLLPGLAVGVAALGVIAAGAVGISGTRGYVNQLTRRVAAGYAAAAGAVLVLLAVAGLTVAWAVPRPLRQAGSGGAMSTREHWSQRAFATALTRISGQLAASRAGEAAADRSVAEMTGCLREVSQELRTSVSIVRGFAEYYRQRGKPLLAAGDPMMRRVADEITRMETLIAQLDVEDPTSAKMPRDP